MMGGGSALRVWKVKRRKKKAECTLSWRMSHQLSSQGPRQEKWKCYMWVCLGLGGGLREGRRTDPLFRTLYKPRGEQFIQLRQRLMMTSYLSKPKFKGKIRRTCSQGNVQWSPSRWPENSYRPTVRRLINQSLRWLWRRALLCNLHGEY